MRGLLSIAMLLLAVFPLVAPALGQTAQQHLLLCCRKGGAHHCSNPLPVDTPVFEAHCPAFPKRSATSPADAGFALPGARADRSFAVSPFRIRQTQAGYRISFYRSRQKRGPPALSFS